MTRCPILIGASLVTGSILGAVLAAALLSQPYMIPTRPDVPVRPFVATWNGVEKTTTTILGVVDESGEVEWRPEDQRFEPEPVGSLGGPADAWVLVDVNGSKTYMLGRLDAEGRAQWRLADQRTNVEKQPIPPADRPIPMGGVVASELRPGHVTASDPADKAKVEYLMGQGALGADPERIPTPPIPSLLPSTGKMIAIGAVVLLVAIAALGAIVAAVLLVVYWSRK